MTELEPAFVTVKEAARYLALSEGRIYKMLDAGILNKKYIGTRNLRIPVESLREYADSLPDTAA